MTYQELAKRRSNTSALCQECELVQPLGRTVGLHLLKLKMSAHSEPLVPLLDAAPRKAHAHLLFWNEIQILKP